MQVFDEKWQLATSPVKIETPGDTQITLRATGTKDVEVYGVPEGKKASVPLKIGRELTVRIRSTAFSAVTLKSEEPFGYAFETRSMQRADPLNDDDPPAPPLPGADNLVAQVHRMMRDNARRNRDPYLDPEALPWQNRYTLEEDDEELFEEELAARKAAKLSKQKPEEGEMLEPDEPRPEPATAAAEPPVQQKGEPEIKHAAE